MSGTVLTISVVCSCNDRNRIYNTVFNSNERQVYDQLIEAYDDFVRSSASCPTGRISKAYSRFLQLNSIMALGSLDVENLLPKETRIEEMLDSMPKDAMEGFFALDEEGTLYLRKDGRYLDMLKALAETHQQYQAMLERTMENDSVMYGDFAVIESYRDFNFNNKLERLLFIVNVLTIKASPSPL